MNVENRSPTHSRRRSAAVILGGAFLLACVSPSASVDAAPPEDAPLRDRPGTLHVPAEPHAPLRLDGHRLQLAAPIDRWDEAIPLGNGLTGGLLWGGGDTINLSLDRGDLWDLSQSEIVAAPDWTYATMQRLVAAKDQARISAMFDAPYDLPYPTKLPAGRLKIKLDAQREVRAFVLDLHRAEAGVDVGHATVRAFFSAKRPVAVLYVPGSARTLELVRPAGLDQLKYAPAEFGSEGDERWMVQHAAGGLVYAIVVASRPETDGQLLTVAITSTSDGPDPLAIGRRRAADAVSAGYEPLLAEHRPWWDSLWATSAVHVPDPDIQAHYELCTYFYGSGSRAGAPPMPLQGVWTADEGGLPPWKGDYHNDLNTQMTYLAYHTAGLTECGRSFLDFNTALLPRYRRFAKEFYGVEGVGGAAVPGVMTLEGAPMGGWGMYSLSPTNGAWVAQSFYLHWRYTMDESFLRGRAYPFCSEIAQTLSSLLKPDARGRLVLPLSSSPEIHDNSLRAWLTPNSNYDLALMRWLFGALAQMAPEAGKPDEAARWRELLDNLDDFDIEDNGGEPGSLTFARGDRYETSHRHFSHAMAIHPLGLLTIEGNRRERAIIDATLDRIIERGTDQWCGYSFSWMSCMLARSGRPEQALEYLEAYQRAFILRNGFHANGDQSGSGGAGLSKFTYRPFTLEGNFLAMQAVQEMLLQSWGGTVRVFPAVSRRWPDAWFHDLRAEGGFRISATRRGGRTVFVRVVAEHGGLLRLRDPFAGSETGLARAAHWNRSDLRRDSGHLLIQMAPGDVLDGSCPPEDPEAP
jgi:alpha-L-fucosidase 2